MKSPLKTCVICGARQPTRHESDCWRHNKCYGCYSWGPPLPIPEVTDKPLNRFNDVDAYFDLLARGMVFRGEIQP